MRLADGGQVPGELVVLTCGVRPETTLARAAGLPVTRGVLVDDRLATADPRVSALGEYAEHRGQVYDLVAPTWEQAAVLAGVLTGRGGTYTGSRTVARLKAAGLTVAARVETAPEPADTGAALEVLTFADPARHVYK